MKNFRIIVLLVLVLSLSSFLFSQRVAPDIVEEIAEIEESDSIEMESVEVETEEYEVVRIGEDLTVFSRIQDQGML